MLAVSEVTGEEYNRCVDRESSDMDGVRGRDSILRSIKRKCCQEQGGTNIGGFPSERRCSFQDGTSVYDPRL